MQKVVEAQETEVKSSEFDSIIGVLQLEPLYEIASPLFPVTAIQKLALVQETAYKYPSVLVRVAGDQEPPVYVAAYDAPTAIQKLPPVHDIPLMLADEVLSILLGLDQLGLVLAEATEPNATAAGLAISNDTRKTLSKFLI